MSTRLSAWGVVFALPGLGYFLVFYLYPIFRAAFLSLHEYSLLGTPSFIGLDNYARILQDPLFWQSVSATVYYVLVSSAVLIPGSLLLALAFQRTTGLGRSLRPVYFLPNVVPIFAAALLWRLLYQPYSLINGVLSTFGASPVPWLTSSVYAMPSMILMRMWKGLGYYGILYFAGLEAIPSEYREAANIDGATGFQVFRYITWPLLKPTTLFVVVICAVNAFSTFDAFYIVTGGGPAGVTRIIGLLVYQTGFQYFKMGEASAISMIMFVVVMVFTLILLRIFRSEKTA